MKLKKYHLIFGVITGILCAAASAQIERPDVDLIGPPNPVLAGIKQLDVVITTRGTDPNKIGLDSNHLKAEIERRLEKAGIKKFTAREDIRHDLAASSDFKVSIEMLNLSSLRQCVFRVQTSLSRAVCLNEQRNWFFKTDVWTTEPVMQIEQLQNISDKVTKIVLSQVDTFIQAHHTANTAGSRLRDANGTLPKELSKAPSQEPVAGYKYAASKNSDVFHTPNCRSAKLISPENLVVYSNRQEAINAGKRPCKVCKP